MPECNSVFVVEGSVGVRDAHVTVSEVRSLLPKSDDLFPILLAEGPIRVVGDRESGAGRARQCHDAQNQEGKMGAVDERHGSWRTCSGDRFLA